MGEGLKRAFAAAAATNPIKLTPAVRRTLEYLAAREYVSAWPADVANRSIRNRLEAAGYMERFGSDPGVFGFIRYRITESGKLAISSK